MTIQEILEKYRQAITPEGQLKFSEKEILDLVNVISRNSTGEWAYVTHGNGDGFYSSPLTGYVQLREDGAVRYPDGTVSYGEYDPHWGYYRYGIRTIHRLMALTFLDPPQNPRDFHVNHIDGDKLKNAKENIEWVSPSENSIHAYETGLRGDNRPMYLMNLETDECFKFYGVQPCARFLETNGANITLYLQGKRKNPWRKKWSMWREGEDKPGLTRDDITVHNVGGYRCVLSVCTETGNKTFYYGVGEAARHTGLSKPALYWYLNRKSVTGTNLFKGCYWSFVDETFSQRDDVNVVGSPPKMGRVLPKKRPKRILVEDIATGTTETWDSLRDYSNHIGWKKNSLEKAIWRNKGVFQDKRFTYLSEESPAG